MTITTKREPDLVGAAGRAWRIALTPEARAQWPAAIDAFIFHAPGQAAAWSAFYVSAIHLRDVPGIPPAHLEFPGATHEIAVYALDDHAHEIDPDDWQEESERRPMRWRLTPVNYQRAIAVRNDADAAMLVDALARAFVDGALPLEPFFSGDGPMGRGLVHNAIDETAKHIREGAHGSAS